MASALTVLFLSCWLAGHSGVWGEPSYPKPNISLSPSWGVSLGGAVAIWCRGQHRDMRFMLNKEGRHFPPVDPSGFEAVFPISNVRWEDGGSYSCSYHSRSEPFAVSSPSDPVELVVRDPSLPRPSISLSPAGVTAPGVDVTIRCQGQRRDVRFFLHKAGDRDPPRDMDPAGDGAEFHIPTVGRQHGGSYSCSYRPPSEPFVSSQPSHPEQLVVACEGPGLASLLRAPPPAGVGDSPPIERSEPGSALSPGPSRGDAWPGSGDGVTGGFPSQGEQRQVEIWGLGGGVSCPLDQLQRRGLFPGGWSPGLLPFWGPI
ncbi:unnamed protein product, partial [Natator depressus]